MEIQDTGKPSYDVKLKWKSFRIHVGRFNSILKSVCGPLYAGISANKDLVIHFADKPSDEIVSRAFEQYAALTEEGEKAKYSKDASEAAAIVKAKANIVYADIASLIPAERKMLLNLPLNSEDKAALVVKHK